jgi:hypothetical protein
LEYSSPELRKRQILEAALETLEEFERNQSQENYSDIVPLLKATSTLNKPTPQKTPPPLQDKARTKVKTVESLDPSPVR